MMYKTGEVFLISLRPSIPQEIQAREVDEPFVTIQNKETGLFFNGLSWQTESHSFAMTYVANGIYSYEMYLSEPGQFIVVAQSVLDLSCEKAVIIEVYDETEGAMSWVKNEPYIITYAASKAPCFVSIQDQHTGLYLQEDTVSWAADIYEFLMKEAQEYLFTYTFTPEQASAYLLRCFSSQETDAPTAYILQVYDSIDDIMPVPVDWKTLRAPDGTDCLIVDRHNKGLEGAKISIFDTRTKKNVNTSYSNADGTWCSDLRPGRYLFVVEKAGYESVSFERMVK